MRCTITSLGERIKTLRQQKRLTLAELAEKSSLSASHLSQIEQDKKMPSLAALTGIAEVLDINPRYLLEPEEIQVTITRASLEADASPAPPVSSSNLTSFVSGSELEVQRLVLQPHTRPLEFEPHAGEVLGFVLEGRLFIAIEDQEIELEAGDSIHYEANQFYRLVCLGEEPCLIIWCNSPRWAGFEARLQAAANIKTGSPVK
jgi:transcriptional regulator with XRE-family HTH domain